MYACQPSLKEMMHICLDALQSLSRLFYSAKPPTKSPNLMETTILNPI